VTVPISKYGTLIQYIKELGAEHDILTPCFGHAGDGNIHYTVLVDPSDADELAAGEEIYKKIVERAIEVGGTATGEHGIGQGKREYMILEHGQEGVDAMQAVKDGLDPNGILNPGKIFPEK
jgi:D-lactate dehydrogenase (cytochrome)